MLRSGKGILYPAMAAALFALLSVAMVSQIGYGGELKAEYLGTMPCTEPVPDGLSGGRIFKMCDGKTKVVVALEGAYSQGRLPSPIARQVAEILYDQWGKMKAARRESDQPLVVAHSGKPHNRREIIIFESELDKMVKKGHAIFHDPSLGTNGISCDMCHPDASNTHPETYPKFQTQLKEVALLRDMINWCIENPMEGKKLADDDPRMKVMEVYILAQRKSVPLEYGKH